MCNRKCFFCPRSDPNYNHVNQFMTDPLFEKICKELSEHNYDGVFVFAGFNEPLLHKKIYEHLAMAKNYLPKSRIEIITNGDVLNKNRIKRLFKSGLSILSISVYDGKEASAKFKEMCVDAGLKEHQYILRDRYYPEDENFGINLTNRGGSMNNASFKIKDLKNPLNKPCFYPSYDFFIDYNGDVLMCSHDWNKENILGDMNHQSFNEIWTSEKAQESRKNLYNNKRNFSPCNVCDAEGSKVGKNHIIAWKNINPQ
jgi:radical SAM protein with 4Fe4S-binding SPASM domain